MKTLPQLEKERQDSIHTRLRNLIASGEPLTPEEVEQQMERDCTLLHRSADSLQLRGQQPESGMNHEVDRMISQLRLNPDQIDAVMFHFTSPHLRIEEGDHLHWEQLAQLASEMGSKMALPVIYERIGIVRVGSSWNIAFIGKVDTRYDRYNTMLITSDGMIFCRDWEVDEDTLRWEGQAVGELAGVSSDQLVTLFQSLQHFLTVRNRDVEDDSRRLPIETHSFNDEH